jgi:glutaredoxin 3
MKPIKIYTKDYCPYCHRAKAFFDSKGLQYKEVDLQNDAATAEKLFAQTGFRTVPQIFIGDECIGGYDSMMELERQGLLSEKLKG